VARKQERKDGLTGIVSPVLGPIGTFVARDEHGDVGLLDLLWNLESRMVHLPVHERGCAYDAKIVNGLVAAQAVADELSAVLAPIRSEPLLCSTRECATPRRIKPFK
jgi:hypothetical protein